MATPTLHRAAGRGRCWVLRRLPGPQAPPSIAAAVAIAVRARADCGIRRSRPFASAIRAARNSAAALPCARRSAISAAFLPSGWRRTARISSGPATGGGGSVVASLYQDAHPSGIADAEMAPILVLDGLPIAVARLVRRRNRSPKTMARSMWRSSGSIRSSVSTMARKGFLPVAVRSRCRRRCGRCPSNRGDRGPGLRAEGHAARRHADRVLGARARQGQRSQRFPDRGPEPRKLCGQAQFRLRHQRCRASARRRHRGAGTQVQLDQRVGSAHPAHPARRDQAGRGGRRSGSVRGRSRLRDRQHGGLERSPQPERARPCSRSFPTTISCRFSARCCCSSRWRSREPRPGNRRGPSAARHRWRPHRLRRTKSTPPRRASCGFAA